MWRQLSTLRPLVLLAVLGLLLAACGTPGSGSAAPTGAAGGGSGATGDVITFGAAISITGKTAKEGEYTRDGYQMFIDAINDQGSIKVGDKTYKTKLIYYDDESNSDRTAQLYEKLINEDKVNFLLGPYGSGTIFGPLIGAAVFQLLNTYLWGQFIELHPTFLGLIIIFFIVFMPRGLMQLVDGAFMVATGRRPFRVQSLFANIRANRVR